MTWSGLLLVACGSMAGALARYELGKVVSQINNSEFPWGTWLINMTGTLLLGLFYQEFQVQHHEFGWFLLLGTGFCGAFTTFSTMSVEAVALLKKQFFFGVLYLGSSLAVGFILAWMANWLISA
ncbi:MAG: hypothetical protein A2201_10110 [Alicyclobacillus sp. RIFOXYA1_FULL_53_8]|nr:MAG: hypothetical protein A2201_10110 [Alicyclobacillus sp. RIFOXYA1_FULL_53_8]